MDDLVEALRLRMAACATEDVGAAADGFPSLLPEAQAALEKSLRRAICAWADEYLITGWWVADGEPERIEAWR